MASGSIAPPTSQILVGSPTIGGGKIYAFQAVASSIEIKSVVTWLNYQYLLTLNESRVNVGSQDADIRVSNGIFVISTHELGLASGVLITKYRISTTFPGIRPTVRQYTPPAYPVGIARAANGRAMRWVLADKAGKAKMQLTYENIEDSQARMFAEAYENAYGALKPFRLPDEVISGMSDDLKQYTELSLMWRWDKSPVIDSVVKGRSNVKVELLGAPIDRSIFDVPIITEPPDPSVKELWANVQYDQYTGRNETSAPVLDEEGNIYVSACFYDGNPLIKYISLIKYSPEGKLLEHRTTVIDVPDMNAFVDITTMVLDSGFVIQFRMASWTYSMFFIGLDSQYNVTYVKRYEGGNYAGINTAQYIKEWNQILCLDADPSGFWDGYGVDMAIATLDPYTGEIILSKTVRVPSSHWLWTCAIHSRPDNNLTLVMGYTMQGNQVTSGAYMVTLSQNLDFVYQRSYEGVSYENAVPFGLGWAVNAREGIFLLDSAYQPYKRYKITGIGFNSDYAEIHRGDDNILYIFQGSSGMTGPTLPTGSYNAFIMQIDMSSEKVVYSSHYSTGASMVRGFMVRVNKGDILTTYDDSTRIKLCRLPFKTSKPVLNPPTGSSSSVIFVDNPTSDGDSIAAYTQYNPIEYYAYRPIGIEEEPISSYDQDNFNFDLVSAAWREQDAPFVRFFDTKNSFPSIFLAYPFD